MVLMKLLKRFVHPDCPHNKHYTVFKNLYCWIRVYKSIRYKIFYLAPLCKLQNRYFAKYSDINFSKWFLPLICQIYSLYSTKAFRLHHASIPILSIKLRHLIRTWSIHTGNGNIQQSKIDSQLCPMVVQMIKSHLSNSDTPWRI